ncbi:MAG: 4Fe-4S binding protein [Termitinemataceae bacterium]|nr:MAG: 4Fe-4S binding protein [Termitinemataceae bacterium]
MKRKIIKINEALCNGCGLCVNGCHEGALQLIDGKAKVINDIFCDGLGTCIGECPQGALKIEEREAAPYNEAAAAKMQTDKNQLKMNKKSELSQWPVQLRLLNPQSPFFKNADIALTADCAAYAFGDFHQIFLKNHALAIACPKLDGEREEYIKKISEIIELSSVNSLSVIIMEVPCCEGLMFIAKQALANVSRKIPLKKIVIGVEGNIITEELS